MEKKSCHQLDSNPQPLERQSGLYWFSCGLQRNVALHLRLQLTLQSKQKHAWTHGNKFGVGRWWALCVGDPMSWNWQSQASYWCDRQTDRQTAFQLYIYIYIYRCCKVMLSLYEVAIVQAARNTFTLLQLLYILFWQSTGFLSLIVCPRPCTLGIGN